MHTAELTLDTSTRRVVDLTHQALNFCRGRGDGLLSVFAPHTTVGLALTFPFLDGRPALGTWQSIVLVDLNVDNPVRTVRLSFLAG